MTITSMGLMRGLRLSFEGAKDVLFQADVDQIRQQQAEAGDSSDLPGVEGQSELVKFKGAKSYV